MNNSTFSSPLTDKHFSNERLAKLRYHCRRGLLELDLLLVRFLDTTFHTLQYAEQCDFERLLTLPDADIYAAMMNEHCLEDPELMQIIRRIGEMR